MTVYDPDLSNGSAEDKAVAYALALGKPTLVIHPQTRKARWVNMPENAKQTAPAPVSGSNICQSWLSLQRGGFLNF